jgi:hypothetical protein
MNSLEVNRRRRRAQDGAPAKARACAISPPEDEVFCVWERLPGGLIFVLLALAMNER